MQVALKKTFCVVPSERFNRKRPQPLGLPELRDSFGGTLVIHNSAVLPGYKQSYIRF